MSRVKEGEKTPFCFGTINSFSMQSWVTRPTMCLDIFQMGEGNPPNIAYLINVNYSLLTEYVKYVNLVLLSKGSSVPLASIADKAYCISCTTFSERYANDSLSNCLNEPERCSFLFVFSYLESSEIEINCRY